MGQYDAVKEVYFRGRMLYKNQDGKYLKVVAYHNNWNICDDLECSSNPVIRSGGRRCEQYEPS